MRIPGLQLAGDLADLPWRATSDGGVHWLPLFLEEAASRGAHRGGATVLIRMAPGAGYAAHRHVGGEDVLVLQGGYRDEQGEYRQGEHVHYPSGSAHAPVALGDPRRPAGPENPACILFASAPLGIELCARPNAPVDQKGPP
jgi:anti-sigma factor ChrR (cupin superfamily)